MKKALSIILSLVMILAAFPLTVFAGDTTLYSVKIKDVKEPSVGNAPNFTANATSVYEENMGYVLAYSVDNVSWHDDTNDKWMTGEDIFVIGNRYTVYINVSSFTQGINTYHFADPMSSSSVTINGNTASIQHKPNTDPTENITVYRQYLCQGIVTNVDITFDNPGNNTPKDSIIPNISNEGVEIVNYSWNRKEDSSNYTQSFNTFAYDYYYRLEVYLMVKENYSFRLYTSADAASTYYVGTHNVNVTVNGKTVYTKYQWGTKEYKSYMLVTYEFRVSDSSKTISLLNVEDISNPTVGESFFNAVSDTEQYQVSSMQWRHNDSNNTSVMDESEIFLSGKKYYVVFILKARNGYRFATSEDGSKTAVNAYFNGYKIRVIDAWGYEPKDAIEVCAYYNFSDGNTALPRFDDDKEPLPHFADGSCGSNVNWMFDSATETLTVSGSGDMSNFSSVNPDYEIYKDYIKHVVVEEGVTVIGEYAFCQYPNIISAKIADSVTWIKAIAFKDCTALTDLIMGTGMRTIGYGAFYGCTALTDVIIPSKIANASSNSFTGCDDIQHIYCYEDASIVNWCSENGLLSKTAYFGDMDFDGNIDLPDYTVIKTYLAGENTNPLTNVQKIVGDYNLDGAIDAFDLFMVDKCVNGLI